MIESADHAMRRVIPLAQGVVLAVALAGCSTQVERPPVDVHAAATSDGVGWTYRAKPFEAEGILTGEKGDFDIQGDARLLSRIWKPVRGVVSVQEDNVSRYILIRLNDAATGKHNPLRGGPFSWGLHGLQERVIESLSVIGEGSDARYSVHLVTLEDDARATWDSAVVAQVRLRRLASVMIEAGVDPRLISGQTWERRENSPWKLALVLRPYRYGQEQTSSVLIAPGSF